MTYQPSPYDPPQQPYQQPYQQPAPPLAKPTSGLALAALITGAAGVVLCFTVLPSIAAVVLGHLAVKDTRSGERAGRGMAIAGLVLGYVVVGAVGLYLTLSLLGTGISTLK